MVWTVARGTVEEEKLKPLGLICHGGHVTGTYRIRGINDDFIIDLPIEKIDNIKYIYNKWLRKNKLEQIERR